jgi:hypothetical protein
MADQPLHMFRYWEEKKGLQVAVEEYYPGLFRRDPLLHAAWTQIQLAEKVIKQRIEELAADEPEEE